MADFFLKGAAMLTAHYNYDDQTRTPIPREGDLYKVINIGEIKFEIYYGYYDEADRQNPNIEPMEMYPNFIETPIYTREGFPFATAIQQPCEHFKGDADEDNTCYQCAHYKNCDELIGICYCKERQRS